MLDLIERKAAGEESWPRPAPVAEDKVVDLMAALEASVRDAKAARGRHPTAKAAGDDWPARTTRTRTRRARRQARPAKKAGQGVQGDEGGQDREGGAQAQVGLTRAGGVAQHADGRGRGPHA